MSWNSGNFGFGLGDYKGGTSYQDMSSEWYRCVDMSSNLILRSAGIVPMVNSSRAPAEVTGFGANGSQWSPLNGEPSLGNVPEMAANLPNLLPPPPNVTASAIPLTPNTQALFRDFVRLPTPVFEKTYQFGSPEQDANGTTDHEMASQGVSAAVSSVSALLTGSEIVRTRSTSPKDMESLWNGFMPSPSFFMPSGFNLWDMSGFNQNTLDAQVMPTLIDTAFDAFSLVQQSLVNATAPQEYPQLSGPASSSSSSSIPSFEDSAFPRLFRAPSKDSTTTVTRKIIDVPPFMRQKLLKSYCYNIKRFATLHMDRLKFQDRLSRGLDSGLHPAFVFSMVSRPALPIISS